MFDNGLDLELRVVLNIAAKAVSKHEYDVDHSFPERIKGLTFLQCLERVGFIVCYGRIAPDSLEVVEHQDERGYWQNGE